MSAHYFYTKSFINLTTKKINDTPLSHQLIFTKNQVVLHIIGITEITLMPYLQSPILKNLSQSLAKYDSGEGVIINFKDSNDFDNFFSQKVKTLYYAGDYYSARNHKNVKEIITLNSQ